LALIGGLLISAIIAASMSTADSQLLLASSAFASDIFKGTIKKNATDKQMVWVSRIVVVVISIVAFVIAFFGDSIMKLVADAWAIFGAAFSPAIIFALYWKRFNYKGCVAGIILGHDKIFAFQSLGVNKKDMTVQILGSGSCEDIFFVSVIRVAGNIAVVPNAEISARLTQIFYISHAASSIFLYFYLPATKSPTVYLKTHFRKFCLQNQCSFHNFFSV
jgi:Na+(H+)/acetate symporter ActP